MKIFYLGKPTLFFVHDSDSVFGNPLVMRKMRFAFVGHICIRNFISTSYWGMVRAVAAWLNTDRRADVTKS